MVIKILLLALGISVILGYYPNILIANFGIYVLDIVVLAIFIYTAFLLKYRNRVLDTFLLIIFLSSTCLLLLNTKLLFNYSSVLYLVRFVVYFLTYPFFTYIAQNTQKFAVKTYYLMLFATILLNLVVFVLFPNLQVPGFDPHKYRLYGQFLDPNYYSVFLILNLHILLNNLNKFKLLLVGLTIVSLIFTVSRLGILLSFVVLIFYFYKYRKIEYILVFLGLILFVFLNSALFSRFMLMEGNFDSLFYRILDFLDGLSIYNKSIIPSGYNNMGVYNTFYTSNFNNSTSFYDFFPLNLMLSGGFIFVLLFVFLFLYIATKAKNTFYRQILFLILIASFSMNVFFFSIFTLYFSSVSALSLYRKNN